MTKKILIILIISILILSLIVTSILSNQVVKAQPTQPNPIEPSITMMLLQDSQLAEADYTGKMYQAGALYTEFDGIIEAEVYAGTTVIVELKSTDTWSSTQVSPPTILFDETEEKTFRVIVKAPKDEKYNAEGTMTINGFWSIYPGGLSGTTESVEGKVIVGQFCNFSLSSPNDNLLAKIGSENEFRLNIRNHGNHHDSFLIKINNLNELENKSIDIRLDTTEVSIHQGFTESITFFVIPNIDLRLLEPSSHCLGCRGK